MIDKLQQAGHLAGIIAGILTKGRAFRGPLWAQIGVSNRCNYRCVMCWDHPSFVPEDDPYPDETISKFYRENPDVDRSCTLMDMALFKKTVEELHAAGTRRVEIIGRGEPFLNDQLVDMLSLVKSKKMNCSITTNGSRLSPEILDGLLGAGLDQLVVSMNAGHPETYGKIHTTEDDSQLHKIKDSLLLLRELKSRAGAAKPFLTLSFVICGPNCKEASEMLALAGDVGAGQVSFKHAILYRGIDFLNLSAQEKVALDRELTALESTAARKGIDLKLEPPIGGFSDLDSTQPTPMEIYNCVPCYVGWLFSLITADGTVLPCYQCYSKMGNIREESFLQIWHSRQYDEFRQESIRLPRSGCVPSACRCDLCALTKLNLSIHNKLNPFHKTFFSTEQREYGTGRLLSSILDRKTI